MSAKPPLTEPEAAWLARVPATLMERLLRALEGSEGIVVDGGVYTALLDELWKRDGHPVDAWPTEAVADMPYEFVRFCRKAKGLGDPEHRPVARKRPRGWHPEYGGPEWQYACSCGARSHQESTRRGDMNAWRVGPCWWPVVADHHGVPQFVVCPAADFADSVKHALRPHNFAVSEMDLGVLRDNGIWRLCEIRGHESKRALGEPGEQSYASNQVVYYCICGRRYLGSEAKLMVAQ